MEIAAVLAVGVAPNLISALSSLCHPVPPPPYWLNAVMLSVTCGCALFVVLYLIGRSGKPWAEFGIVGPRVDDLLLGVFLFMVAVMLWWSTPEFLWSVGTVTPAPAPTAGGPLDIVLLVTKYVLAASAEEVVTRAYLVTRLGELWRSRGAAVFVSAILFSSYHAYQGLAGCVYTFAFGLLYGITFLILGRIWPLILGHALYNIWVEVCFG